MNTIIGRKEEIDQLGRIWQSNDAEFLAVYGRRRVGKTYLIREYFSYNKGIYIEITGIKDGSLRMQLDNFAEKISKIFFKDVPLRAFLNWNDAFEILTQKIEAEKNKKVTLFFDELPWMATRRSKLIQALDYFWNTRWSRLPYLKVIVCGSAASWILDNLINAKGGLYNRLTSILLLKPFDLKTAKLFLAYYHYKLSNKQVLDLFMVTGGIPFYLKQIDRKKSVIQNINALCFEKNGLLLEEFPRLFKSLFEQSEINLKLVKAIANKRYGISREALLNKVKMKSGGSFNKRLKELESAGFIRRFIPHERKKDVCFRVIDEYTLFYLYWMEPEIKKGYEFTSSYWQHKVKMAAWQSWAGYLFEGICLKHIEPIRKALKLTNIGCRVGSWRFIPKKGEQKDGAQIDLLFDRDDDAVTVCEIKFTSSQFKVDKAYAKNLLNKLKVYEEQIKTSKQIFLALITTMGLKQNLYSKEFINNNVCLEDLFK